MLQFEVLHLLLHQFAQVEVPKDILVEVFLDFLILLLRGGHLVHLLFVVVLAVVDGSLGLLLLLLVNGEWVALRAVNFDI